MTLKGPFAHDIAQNLGARLKRAHIDYNQTCTPVHSQSGLGKSHVNDFFATCQMGTGPDGEGVEWSGESVQTRGRVKGLLGGSLAVTGQQIVQAIQYQKSLAFHMRRVLRRPPTISEVQNDLLVAKLAQHKSLAQQVRLAHPKPQGTLQQYLQSDEVLGGYVLLEHSPAPRFHA